MAPSTIDRDRFIRRVYDDVARFPMQLPDRVSAMEVDTALCHFVSQITPGTRAGDLPKMMIDSGLFEFDTWTRRVSPLVPHAKPEVVSNIIKRALLNRLTKALKAQNVGGVVGRDAVFS